ncbi:MAG: VWA domain-containing protein [Vicinamibacterales bacterium]
MKSGHIIACVTVLGVLASGVSGVAGRQNASQFRATTDVVIVPVSVKSGTRVVPGLTAVDFELLDEGIVQDVTLRMVETLPIDVTLVVDTSGSVRGRALEQFKGNVRRIAETLQVNDRLRLLTFAANVSDASGLQSGGVALDVERIEAGGATSFYTALAAAVVAFPLAERPQFIFGFSDGADNMSFEQPGQVRSLVLRSGNALYLQMGQSRSAPGREAEKVLRDAAERSGGALYTGDVTAGLPEGFERALTDFRTSYVLTYTPRGVSRSGWHNIVVRTKERKYTVRARSGYDAE